MPHSPSLSNTQLVSVTNQLKSQNPCVQIKGLQNLQTCLSKPYSTANSSLSTSSAATTLLVSSGLLRHILPLLRSNELPLQEAAWKLLQLLTSCPRASQGPIRSPMGRLIAHLAALCSSGPNLMCKQEASHALRCLSQPDCTSIVRAGVLPLLVQAIQAVPVPTQQATSAAMSELCEQAVIINLVEVLASVAEHSDQGKDQVILAGGVKSLGRLVTCDSVLCQQAALQVLVVLSWGQDRHRDAVMEEDVIPGLVTVLQQGFAVRSAIQPTAQQQSPRQASSSTPAVPNTELITPPTGASGCNNFSQDTTSITVDETQGSARLNPSAVDLLSTHNSVSSWSSSDDSSLLSTWDSIDLWCGEGASSCQDRDCAQIEMSMCLNSSPELGIEERVSPEACSKRVSQDIRGKVGASARRKEKTPRVAVATNSKSKLPVKVLTTLDTNAATTSAANSNTRTAASRVSGHRRSASMPAEGSFSLHATNPKGAGFNADTSAARHCRTVSHSQPAAASRMTTMKVSSSSGRSGGTTSARTTTSRSASSPSSAASVHLPRTRGVHARSLLRSPSDSTHRRSVSHPAATHVSHSEPPSPLAAHSQPNRLSRSRQHINDTSSSRNNTRTTTMLPTPTLSQHRRTQSAIPTAPTRGNSRHTSISTPSSSTRMTASSSGASKCNNSSRFISQIPCVPGVSAPSSSHGSSASNRGCNASTYTPVQSHTSQTPAAVASSSLSHRESPPAATLLSPSVSASAGGSSRLSPQVSVSVEGSSELYPQRCTPGDGSSRLSPERSSSVEGSSRLSPPESHVVEGSSRLSPPVLSSVEGSSRENPPSAAITPATVNVPAIASIASTVQISVSSAQLTRIHSENKCDAAAVLYELARDSMSRTARVKSTGALAELTRLAVGSEGSEELKAQAALTAWQLVAPSVAGPHGEGHVAGMMLQDIFISMLCQGGPAGV